MRQTAVEMPNAEVSETALSSELGHAKAGAVIQRAQERFNTLFAERKWYANRALRQHLEENILPGLALYQALLAEDHTRERALQLEEAALRAWTVPNRWFMERMGRLPFFYGLMRLLIKPMMRFNFPAEGWEVEWVEKSGNELAFNMKSCFYKDVFEEYGAPELTALSCLMDDMIYEDVSPYVRWARTRTLGRGDACCDFRYVPAGRR